MTKLTVGADSLVNPARAGMIPVTGVISGFLSGKPRASGDDPPALYSRTMLAV